MDCNLCVYTYTRAVDQMFVVAGLGRKYGGGSSLRLVVVSLTVGGGPTQNCSLYVDSNVGIENAVSRNFKMSKCVLQTCSFTACMQVSGD